MKSRSLGPICLLSALLLLVPAAPGQDEGTSMRELKVQEILASCQDIGVPTIWAKGDELAALGSAAKRAIQQGLKDASVEGRLAGLKALVALGSPTFAAEKLLDIAADEALKPELRTAAIELVGLTDEEDAEDGLLELLVAFDPRIKIAAARALWRLDTPRATRAKRELIELLKSTDAELRAQGTLALAEMGDSQTPGVKTNLRELMKEPGERGRLAAALYQKLNLQSVIQMYEARGEATAAATRSSPLWKHLDEIRGIMKQAYDLDEDLSDEEMRIRAARGLLDLEGDPHTQFMTPDEYREFMHGSTGVDPSYGGIGAFIDTNIKDRFRILRPIFGGPAWDADIRGGDDIIAVNGKPTAGRSTTDIIRDVKGPPGTPVILTIFREGWSATRDIKVIRAKIVLPTVFSRMLPGDIGYVSIAQFAFETGQELEDQLNQLEAKGMRGLIIDLRDNPGGLLGSVKQCLTPFLKTRELVAVLKSRFAEPEKHFTGAQDHPRPYPISVLVNERSASGAELMSGVLQHYSKSSGRAGAETPYVDAVAIGTPTFGKGTVQHTLPLQRTWPGEKFTDTARGNGLWDPGERFTDQNNNGRFDPGEPFLDRPVLNRRWDEAEKWVDTNGNGKWDEGETFTDENGDGKWNPAEEFEDANGNGEYDFGAAMKLSIARYYLPGGKNFTRTRVFDQEEGQYIYKGGVEPDIELEREQMPIAHLVELRELQEKGVFRDYVKSQWAEHKQRFHELSHFDARDTSLYPGFDAFYEGLRTRLTPQEVRRAVRIEVRREVSNEQGREILGDLSDDNVLRRGVLEVLRRLGVDPTTVPEYRSLNDAVNGK